MSAYADPSCLCRHPFFFLKQEDVDGKIYNFPYRSFCFLRFPIASAEPGASAEEGIPCVYPLLSKRHRCCSVCVFLCVLAVYSTSSGVLREYFGFKRHSLLGVCQSDTCGQTAHSASFTTIFLIFFPSFTLTHPLLCNMLLFNQVFL